MKRFQKALLGVMVSGALLFSAQAAELPSAAKDTLQSAIIKAQQEIKDYGQVKTLGFTGENCEIILSNPLSPYDGSDRLFYRKYL